MRLTATELQGSVCADHQLQTLQLKSGRALDITVVPPRDGVGAHDGTGERQVPPAVPVPDEKDFMSTSDGSPIGNLASCPALIIDPPRLRSAWIL